MPYKRFYLDVNQDIPLEQQTWLMPTDNPGRKMDRLKRYTFEVLIPEPECERADEDLKSIRAEEVEE